MVHPSPCCLDYSREVVFEIDKLIVELEKERRTRKRQELEIAQLTQDILIKGHNDPEMLDGLTPRVAQQYKNLTGDINSLAGAEGEEDSETGETRQLVIRLGENIDEQIEKTYVQTVIPGHETRQAMAVRAGTAAECSVKLLTSVDSLNKVNAS